MMLDLSSPKTLLDMLYQDLLLLVKLARRGIKMGVLDSDISREYSMATLLEISITLCGEKSIGDRLSSKIDCLKFPSSCHCINLLPSLISPILATSSFALRDVSHDCEWEKST